MFSRSADDKNRPVGLTTPPSACHHRHGPTGAPPSSPRQPPPPHPRTQPRHAPTTKTHAAPAAATQDDHARPFTTPPETRCCNDQLNPPHLGGSKMVGGGFKDEPLAGYVTAGLLLPAVTPAVCRPLIAVLSALVEGFPYIGGVFLALSQQNPPPTTAPIAVTRSAGNFAGHAPGPRLGVGLGRFSSRIGRESFPDPRISSCHARHPRAPAGSKPPTDAAGEPDIPWCCGFSLRIPTEKAQRRGRSLRVRGLPGAGLGPAAGTNPAVRWGAVGAVGWVWLVGSVCCLSGGLWTAAGGLGDGLDGGGGV